MGVRLLCLLIGYAIVGRMRGIDIREHGSGNAGTTNAMRVMGTKDGLLVFFMDTFKSFFALFTVQALLGAKYPELIYLLKIYALAGCVLGHDCGHGGFCILLVSLDVSAGRDSFVFHSVSVNALCIARLADSVSRVLRSSGH